MYIFAKNAVQLPDSPDDCETGVAYRKTPSPDFISNGLRSNDFVETAQLNDWLCTLTALAENLSRPFKCEVQQRGTSISCRSVMAEENLKRCFVS